MLCLCELLVVPEVVAAVSCLPQAMYGCFCRCALQSQSPALPLTRSACRAVWYCGTACSRADWRAGNKHVCKVLAAERQAAKAARAATAAAAAEAAAGQQQEEAEA